MMERWSLVKGLTMESNFEVREIKGGFLVRVGAISFQLNQEELERLSVKIAKALDVNLVDDEELQRLFKRYDKLNIKRPTLVVRNANANSSKSKPLGR